jgi:hypothetical protein
MASGADQLPNVLPFPAVDVYVLDWTGMDEATWRAEFDGNGARPFDNTDTQIGAAPLWQACVVEPDMWEWLAAGPVPAHRDLGWQAERLLYVQRSNRKLQFGAILGMLEWEQFKLPVCGVLMCMTLSDVNSVQKPLLLLVEPAGQPRRWETFVVKRLRRCEMSELYHSRIITIESPPFTDEIQLRDTVRKILQFIPLRLLRLNDVCHGMLSDLSMASSS